MFGVKGGAAGGGYAQVVPMEDLNLHFTGDLHAITAANNLLAALIDAHLLHGNALGIDPLPDLLAALPGHERPLAPRRRHRPRRTRERLPARRRASTSPPRARSWRSSPSPRDLADLRERLGRITVGQTYDGEPVTAEQLKAAGSLAVLLKDAVKPNLVQTLEGQPAFVHCGPFANIAHGNNSLVADRVALKLGDYVVTESGFASDMGMEKFFDITCRIGDLRPERRRARGDGAGAQAPRREHGRRARRRSRRGAQNLARHIGIVNGFGLQAVVGVNRFPTDTDEELELVRKLALEHGAYAAEINEAFERGGEGATALAEAVVDAAEQPSSFDFSYPLDAPIEEKIRAHRDARLRSRRRRSPSGGEAEGGGVRGGGLGELPICMAKTHLSLSHDPTLRNAPKGFTVPMRDLRPYTGAGWIVALCGDMMTMPGLGKTPAAFSIDIDESGETVGLF